MPGKVKNFCQNEENTKSKNWPSTLSRLKASTSQRHNYEGETKASCDCGKMFVRYSHEKRFISRIHKALKINTLKKFNPDTKGEMFWTGISQEKC